MAKDINKLIFPSSFGKNNAVVIGVEIRLMAQLIHEAMEKPKILFANVVLKLSFSR